MVRCRAQLVYVHAEQKLTERNYASLTNAPNTRKWWFAVRTDVFGASSSLAPLVDTGDRLVWLADEIIPCFQRTLTLSSAAIVFNIPGHICIAILLTESIITYSSIIQCFSANYCSTVMLDLEFYFMPNITAR